MRLVLGSVGALLGSVLLLMLANGLLGTLLGVRMMMAEFPNTIAGAVSAAYFVGFVMGSLYGHHLIRAVGHIRVFAALASTFSAATLAHAFWVEPVLWGLLRLIAGFCIAGLFICTESWLNARSTNQSRGAILSAYSIVLYLAQAGGQLLLGVAEAVGFSLFVVSSILASMALVPVSITRIQAPDPGQPTAFGLKRLYGISPLGVTSCVSSGMVLGAFYGMGPIFAQQAGMDVVETGRFILMAIVGGVLFQYPLGRLSDKIDRRYVIIGVALLVAVASAGIAAIQGTAYNGLLFILAVGYGGGAFLLYPLAVAHANDHLDSADLLEASGGLLLSYGLGAAMGPMLAAYAMDKAGPGGMFIFCGGVALATAVFTYWRLNARPAVDSEDKAAFQTLPRTTPYATEMHPEVLDDQLNFDFGQGPEPEPPAAPIDD